MYYFFYDNKTGRAFKKSRKLFADLEQKKPDASFLSFDEESVSLDILQQTIESQGLFESKIVAYLKNISENPSVSKELKKTIKSMASSQSIFVIVETDLKKSDLEVFEEYAEKSFIEKEVVEDKKEKFNTFSIADSFGGKDKKTFWRLILESKERGIPAEEVHGILWWQLKSMILSSVSKTAEESGLKPFVYTKSKSFAKNFKDNELQILADKFIAIYHDAHRGECDIYDELEKIALEF